ncbi:intraflagellar transport protein 43 homolog A isoform X3 [Halyomorpha halys]|uniref:intraflagellar transport protein 43 homolog A isoform X3 n=1 Tax=Halyomorpha halys TaxID=286706 RepID=UPI0006D50278|nr:intraflagellar transport protein 43 homolog A isoform X1 [Halyomorpha halys]XP_014278816.1 intraflagellar transport protein 43 homolog A isoform X2 [Halyomorpha halys]
MDSDFQFSPEHKSFFGEPSAPPRARKTGVWSDENVKSAKSKKSGIAGFFEQERFQSAASRGVKKQDSEDDIPVIPDVEDLQDDDQLGDIADAPVVSTNVPSLSELNADLKKQSLFKYYDNINMGLLSKHLFKESEIREEDNLWSWDLLFTEVSSELRSEWEKNNSTKL